MRSRLPAPRRKITHCIEALEDRIAPATLVSLNGGTHLLTVQGDYVDDGSFTPQAGAAESISFSVSGGNLLVTDPAHHVTASGPGVTQVSSGQVNIPLALLLGDISIDTGTGADALTFNDTLALAADHTLTAHSAGTIAVAAGSSIAASGVGGVSLISTHDVSLTTGSSVTAENGNLTLSGNAAGATSGNFTGVNVDGATVKITGTGTLSVIGAGGDDSGGYQLGVQVINGGKILGGTAGSVSVTGTAGPGTGIVNRGVTVYGAGSAISSTGADVTVLGFGGNASSAYGIGVSALFGAEISAGGGGALHVTGTGAGAAGSSSNSGVELGGSGTTIVSAGGDVTVTATAGPGASAGLSVDGASAIGTPQGGNILIVSDRVSLTAGGKIYAATGSVSLHPLTQGANIDVGSTVDTTPGTLELSDAELDFITGPTVQIGDSNSGMLSVTAAITHPGAGNLTFAAGTGQSIHLNADVSTSGGLLSFASDVTVGANATVDTTSGGTVSAGAAISFGGAINLQPGTLTYNAGATDTSLNSVISGPGGLTKLGSGALTLASGDSSYTGDITIVGGTLDAAGGTLVTNSTVGSLGNPLMAHTVYVKAGTTLRFDVADVFGRGGTVPLVTIDVTGGTVTNVGGGFNALGPVILDGGTLTTVGGNSPGYQSYQFTGTVSVVGTAPSTVGGGGAYAGIHLGGLTGIDVSGGASLTISVPLLDQPGSPGSPGALNKTGPGKLTLTADNPYAGFTTVTGGTLALVNTTSNNTVASSSLLQLMLGATLDVTALGLGTATPGLILNNGQTLSGSFATVNGNLGGLGTIQPGGNSMAGTLTVNGNFAPLGMVSFDVNSPYLQAGFDYDQIVVSGSVDLSAATLSFNGGATPPVPGQTVKLISKTSAGLGVASVAPAEASFVSIAGTPFQISYRGGDGNDLVLSVPGPGHTTISTTLARGTLTISESDSGTNLSVSSSGGNLVFFESLQGFANAPAGGTLSADQHTLTVPSRLVTGSVIVQGLGDDTLTLSVNPGGKLPAGGLTFNAGGESLPGNNQLLLTSGGKGVVTFTPSTPTSGTAVLSSYGSIKYSGIDAVVDTGAATDLIFNLPGTTDALLADDGALGNGVARLSGSSFTRLDFASPGNSVTINHANATDLLTIGDVSDLASNLTIGSAAHPFAGVTFTSSHAFAGTLNLAVTNFVLPAAQTLSASGGTLFLGGGTIYGQIGGGLGLTKIVGSDLTLNSDNTYTGETYLQSGPLILGSAMAAQNSTIRIGSSFALQFASSLTTFSVGGLAGTGDLPLADASGEGVTLKVGDQTSTYAGSLSGPGVVDKVGEGILTLTGHNTHDSTLIESGILQINSDQALGQAGSTLTFHGGTLHAVSTFTTSRPISIEDGSATFEASPGKTLTLAGVISGGGSLRIGPTGTVQVTGAGNTNTGGTELDSNATQTVNGVSVSAPGTHGGIMVTPGATPNSIRSIDLSGATSSVALTIKAPVGQSVVVEQIVNTSNTPIKAITLGAGVTLGNGVADNIPDLVVNGKLGALSLSDVSANTIIQLGKGLSAADTLKNAPNLTLNNILGDGVVVDLTGDGTTGGGGLGKVVVNSWSGSGTIKTAQSIKSLVINKGDLNAFIQVGRGHAGAGTQLVGLSPSLHFAAAAVPAVASAASLGSVSIPNGSWVGPGMQVDGVVAQFLTKGLAKGSTISAGAFGTINIKGTFSGSIVATYDPSVTTPIKNKPATVVATGAIGNVTISGGDFTGLVSGDGKVGNVMLTGTARFMGTLRGGSIGNITASSFTGTPPAGGVCQTITAMGSIGNITASVGGLTDYVIAAGVDLGSDARFGGATSHYASYTTSTTGVKTAVAIGAITVKGNVTGSTIAAGVDPGATGVFGGDADATLPLPADVKGKTKIGAIKFDMSGADSLAFTGTAGQTVGNAFEAQSLTSVRIGPGSTAATLLRKFDTSQYIDSGSASIVVRVLP